MAEWTSTIDFTGIERSLVASAARATQAVGEQVLTESRRISPSEDGTLDRSATVTTETTAGAAVTAVAYDTPYAVRQHERLDYHHDSGESAKYLETPLVAAAATAGETAAAELRKALR